MTTMMDDSLHPTNEPEEFQAYHALVLLASFAETFEELDDDIEVKLFAKRAGGGHIELRSPRLTVGTLRAARAALPVSWRAL